MFKIESYLAPLLMGYIDKYVKLRTEDFQLSLWGGDVVLNNLDLRLEAIEHAIQLPIIFKSGHIHELRIHVPWTKLRSEPVVITINTIECILKVRDTGYEGSGKTTSPGVQRSASQQKLKLKQRSEAPDLPPGYLQSLLTKIVHNLNIVVNNLILKFVEDDIVLSLNVKSAECYSVDKDWSRAFVELSPLDLVLRKVVSFCDLTVCLDKTDASGKIEMYQDPVLYRSSVTCRLHMAYEAVHAKYSSVTKVNVFCDKLDLTLTDTQLPMVIRLIQLCLAIYYGDIDLSSNGGGDSAEPTEQEVFRSEETEASSASPRPSHETDVGWGEWAWSFVPQILPEGEGELEDSQLKTMPPSPPIISIAFYIPKASVTFKLTESIRESIHYGPNKVSFRPILQLEVAGLGLEVLAEGLRFVDVQLGITNLSVTELGECVCGHDDTKQHRSTVLLSGGTSLTEPRPMCYSTGSLFDPMSPDNRGEVPEYITDLESHMAAHTESFGLEKYGMFWMDYVYTFEVPESHHGSRSSTSGETDLSIDVTKETASLRFLVGPSSLNVTSSLYHRVTKLFHCSANHQYEPYHKPRDERPVDDRGPPSDQQVAAMEEFIPTRSYHLTLVRPIINVLAAEHATSDVRKRRRHTASKKQKGKKTNSPSSPPPPTRLPAVRLSADRLDFQMTSAMYDAKLVSLVSKMAGPSSNLLHHCYSHTQIKVFSIQVGLTYIDDEGNTGPVLTVLPACSGALYRRSLISPQSWQNLHLSQTEWMYEAPGVSVSLTKPQVLLAAHIYSSWRERSPDHSRLRDSSLLEDTFRTTGVRGLSRESLLEVTISGLELKHCSSPLGVSATGTLTALHALLYAKVDGRDSIIPIISAPSRTKLFRSPTYFMEDSAPDSPENTEDWVTFTLQLPSTSNTPEVPAVILAEVGGLSCCLDPTLYQWLLYSPRYKTDTRGRSGADDPKVVVDMTLANAASPLNPSQLSAQSESSIKDRSESLQTPTNPTQGPQQTTSSPAVLATSAEKPTRKLTSGSELPGKLKSVESEDVWGSKCADVFPLIRILQVQVSMSSFCAFLPKSPVVVGEAGMEIADNLRGVFRSGTLPDTVAVCLPSLRLHSCGFKPVSALQEIPIPTLEGTLAGEKLPWTIKVSDVSVYTLHKMRRALSLLKPTDFSCTVAVTSKFNPPTSDSISSLGACVHLDMTQVSLAVSPIQAQTLVHLMSQVTAANHQVIAFWGPFLSSDSTRHRSVPTSSKTEVQPEKTTSPPNVPVETSVSGGEVVTTETSEEFSRETTPSRELEIEELQSPGVKLSLWLQWTLPKFEVVFYGQDVSSQSERCVSFLLEELSTSIDLQEIYGKVKAKVGLAKVNHYVRSHDQSVWIPGENKGLLVSGPSTLPKNIQIVSNKLWSSDNLTSPMGSLYTVSEAVSRDKKHGLFSFTFTRALCKNVKRRMRKLNVELAGLHDSASSKVQEMLSHNYRKYVSEICLSVEPCDIVTFRPAISVILDVLNVTAPKNPLVLSKPARMFTRSYHISPIPTLINTKDSVTTNSSESLKAAKNSPISSASLPLLYVNISNLRLFVPVSDDKSSSNETKQSGAKNTEGKFIAADHKGEKPTTSTSSLPTGLTEEERWRRMSSTLTHDMFLLQLSSLQVNPQADNPLPRCVLETELYRRALDAGITQHPGSQLEDRQYQLDVKGLTFCSGVWGEFARRIPDLNQTGPGHKPQVQIPAVEWNNLVSPTQKERDIRVIPLASRFDFKIVLAPAIVYSPPVELLPPVKKQCLVVCGHAIEINITSDLDFYLSSSQLNLLHRMVTEQLSPPVCSRDKITTGLSESRSDKPLNDSGVESDASTVTTQVLNDSGMRPATVNITPTSLPMLMPQPAMTPQPVPTPHQVPSSSHMQSSLNVASGSVAKERTPLDILLTAGRITCMVYSHNVPTDASTSAGGKQACKQGKMAASKNKQADRGKKSSRYTGKKGSYREPWTSCGYLADESSDEFEGTYDPAAHLSFLSLHPKVEQRSVSLDDSGVVLVPFLLCYFSQPHAVVSLQPALEKLEISCYDIMLKGSASDQIIKVDDQKVLPDCSDYCTHWLETRAGSPNLKTGVPPSLITVRVTDLLHGPAAIVVEVERPLRLSPSLTKWLQVMQFMEETVATWRDSQTPRADNPVNIGEKVHSKQVSPGDQKPSAVDLLGQRIKSVELQTEQVIVCGQALTDNQSPFVLLAAGSINTDVEIHLSDTGDVSEIVGNCFAKDILVKTGFENRSRLLIGPLSLNSDCVVQWGDHSGPSWQPRVTIVTDMGLVSMEIGQEHVMCFEMFQEHFAEFFQKDDQSSSSTTSPDTLLEPILRRTSTDFIVEQTTDDLKSGTFQYIIDEGDGLHPNPGEIVFGVETEVGGDTMTWSYSQPRVLSHFSVTPVPFNVSEDGSDTQVNIETKVPCFLQYWDVMERQFVNLYEFFLSEHIGCELSLPEVKPHATDLVTALMWRVVMSTHNDVDLPPEEKTSMSSDGRSSSMVLPMSLAACIRVDSCFVPCLIPSLQIALSVSLLQVHLSNHTNQLADEIPSKLQPFHFDSSAPTDQEFAVVTIDNLGVIASRVQGLQASSNIQVSGEAKLEVTEYKFLTKQAVIDPVSFHGNFSLLPDKKDMMLECCVDLDPVVVRLGKGTVHTISSAAQAWAQMLTDSTRQNESPQRIIFNHYTVCNDTQQSIRFGQVGTDENVCMLSREMSLYSWRTHTLPQRLHLCLDGAKWQWCEPFSISQPGCVVRRVSTADQTYTVIIRVNQLSSVHTQVIISGQLVMSSRLSQSIELKLMVGQSESTATELSTVLGPGSTCSSWVLEHWAMRSLRVRITGLKTLWSQEVYISGERMVENRLLKIPLHSGGRAIHIWCRIFQQKFVGATQTLVLLSPLYVVRSELPHPLYLNLDTPRLKAQSQLTAPGQGRELQLECVGGDITHNLAFQLGPHLAKSSPPVTLSTGVIEQVARSPLGPVDIPTLCYGWKQNHAQCWPYNSVEADSVGHAASHPSSGFSQTTNISAGSDPLQSTEGSQHQPNIDLSVSLLEYWPGCNTLLITVTPFCLLVNHSGMDLVALTTMEDSDWLEVPNGNTVAPPSIQSGLRLGVRDDEGLAVCAPVSLSEEEWSLRRHRSSSEQVLYTDGHVHVSILTVTQSLKQMCLLTLQSHMSPGMRVITVRERFAVSSLLPQSQLEVTTYALPLGQTVQVPIEQAEQQPQQINVGGRKSKPTTSPLLYWRVLSGETTEDVSFVQYLSLRNICDGKPSSRSFPLRVTATENGTRSTVTLPKSAQSSDEAHTLPLVVTGHIKGGVTYLVIQEDRGPTCVIHNHTPFPLGYGQTLLNLSTSDYTVQEETELFDMVPSVLPFSNAHYTFPFINNKFPEVYDTTSLPRLHLTTQLDTPGNRAWSSGIDVSLEQDGVFSITGGPDLKVHVEKTAMVTHIVVSPISKADISAKEIRSRIKGKEATVTVIKKAEESTNMVSDKIPTEHSKDINEYSIPESPKMVESVVESSITKKITDSSTKDKTGSHVSISLSVFLKHFCFVLLDETSSADHVGEVLRVSLDNAFLAYYPVGFAQPQPVITNTVKKYCLGVCVGDVQVDNQCFDKGEFDFPVMLIKQRKADEKTVDVEPDFYDLNVLEKHALLRKDSLLHVQLVLISSSYSPSISNQSLEAAIQPLCIFIDDSFVYRILKEIELLIPVSLSTKTFRPVNSRYLPHSIQLAACNGACPAAFQSLGIQPIKILLSVHASLKVFIASDQTPLTFGRFERSNVFTTSYQLTKALVMHYVSGAIFRAGLVVGSLDVLGNPTGLVRSVGSGVADLFRLPYAGLTRSPGAFVAGVSNGMASFFRNISAGTLSSITNFAASVSRNMDRLSLDNDHYRRQEENRRTRPDRLSTGIKQGLTGFGLSLLGAVAGLADQPIQGALQGTQPEARAASTATGIVSGVGKGLMGVVTKPIGGAAEFVSQTGQGFLQSTGLVRLAEHRYRPVEEVWAAHSNSRIKHLWKILHSLPPGNSLLMELPATQYDASDHPNDVILLLTTDILFVLSCEDDAQQQAFTAIELDCLSRVTEPSLITIVWRDSFHHALKQDLTADRVAEYVDKSSSFVSLAGLDAPTSVTPQSSASPPQSPESDVSAPPQFHFHIDPNYRDTFLSWLRLTKSQLMGQGFQF